MFGAFWAGVSGGLLAHVLRYVNPAMFSVQKLAEVLAMVYFGGGYPENFASGLEANRDMRNSIRELFLRGVPIYGECGGFMYLTRSIEVEGRNYPMVGLYPFSTRMLAHRKALGYREVALKENSLLGPKGLKARGHEFHYSEIELMPESVQRAALLDDGRSECYLIDKTLAGYIHLHWGGTPETARYFVHAMQEAAKRL